MGLHRLPSYFNSCPAGALHALPCPAQLASGSADLQKIAVFEGAFDRLFSIIR